ncbi:GDSL-type esterase/lipase family protein [Bacteroidota bacterium]
MKHQHSILFLGDSLSEWFDYAYFFPGLNILNHGIAGDTSSGVIHRLDEVIEDEPSKIFLMIGVNDLFHKIDKETVSNNHKRIIETLSNKLTETQLLIQSMLPVNEEMLFSMKLNSTIKWLNANLKEYCKELNLRFINLYDHFLKDKQLSPEYTTDGGHLSKSGYKLWADLIKNYI